MDEKTLVKSCQKGDRKAFELLVHQYSPTLMGICQRYMKDESASKDALQECFITVFRSIDGFKATGSFEGWLKRIAVTSSLKELRKRNSKLNKLTMVYDSDHLEIGTEPVALEKVNADSVLKHINALPEEYRIVFNMYVIEGFTYEEIADLLDLKESSCRMRVSRARQKLHSMLLKDKDYYGFAESRKVD